MSPDPHAAEWRQVAADLGALAENQVREAFGWIDRELATGGRDGAAALVLSLHDLNEGRPLRAVLLDLLYFADAARDGRDRQAERSGAP